MLGSNIKVHFAGSEYQQSATDSLQLAKVHYRLFTVYPMIANKPLNANFVDTTGVVKRQQQIFNHVIMDSGLFTLMFGSGNTQKQTRQSLELWQDKTFEFIKQNNYNGSCVEIDCQKLLGVEEAWYFRKRMRDAIGNKCINVFHYEDGKDGLDSLIDFSEYIAISVPELRIIHPKTFREDVYKLATYIKNKKPSIDIHLLGCTDKKMLKQNNFCTSADSSSWTEIYRFATIQGKNIYNLKSEIYKQYEKRYRDFLGQKKWNALTDKMKRRNVWELFSAEINKSIYEQYAGSQE